MAITKLMHMKEAPAVPHRHLANAVKYILDEKNNEAKTCDGLYVGGNAGYDSEDIIKTFLDTKELYGKLHGRQGYHFVISFEPGETNADEAYKITKEFAKKYLGENYDYVLQRTLTKIISIRTLYSILSAELMATNTDMKMVTGKGIYSR